MTSLSRTTPRKKQRNSRETRLAQGARGTAASAPPWASVTQAHKCLALLDGQALLKEWLVLTKTYVPANILKCSTEELKARGLGDELASRVKKMMILRIIWMDKKRKLAIHAGDITKYVLMTPSRWD
jgi:hypothetical protein